MRLWITCLYLSACFLQAEGIRSNILSAIDKKILLSLDRANPNTLTFIQDPKFFSFKEALSQKPMFHQNIGNSINQIYYSTKINFDFEKHFYLQSGKIFRKINIQRSSKRHEGERVRLIFVGFEY